MLLPKAEKYLSDMRNMLLFRLRKNQYIVQIHDHKPDEKIPEYLVHEVLEDGRGITEFKGHDEILVVTLTSIEGRLPFIALANPYQVVGPLEIQFSKDIGPL
ncbi:hypothetical protein FKM82_006707 [Ascaphus truei]